MAGSGGAQHGCDHLVPSRTLLEAGFPAAAISELARSGRHRPPRVYGAHKWWARRPAESIRALLIAASLPEGHEEHFWFRLADPRDQSLQGGRVGDPFVGGGTSLVEAQQLGAAVYGVDVDPLAVLITEHELEHLDLDEFSAAAERLLRHLREELGDLYPEACPGETPIHYFTIRRVVCPSCGDGNLLYKSPVIARDTARRGAVVRDAGITAFCPYCLSLHVLALTRKVLDCCGRRTRLHAGTYRRARYVCHCGVESSHEQLSTAAAEAVLIAVEVTTYAGHRKIRKPTKTEQAIQQRARRRLANRDAELVLPRAALTGALKLHKPGIYGFGSIDDLFSARQLLLFGTAFRWLRDQLLSRRVKSALALALSNALSSNNLLCGYARDYGRLAPLFSVRDYSLPVLAVELNPLHPTAGRGTLAAMLRRVTLSKCGQTPNDQRDSSVRVADAAHVVWPDTGGLDIVMTDPPYFDYIAYSDLSRFFRAWLSAADLIEQMPEGRPLFEGSPSRADFSRRLAAAMKRASRALKPDGLIVFTYHASNALGWQVLAGAIADAGLSLTAAFPLWADGHSPGHGHAGNLEYDVVFCCRKSDRRAWIEVSAADWHAKFAKEKVRQADWESWQLAAIELNKFAGDR